MKSELINIYPLDAIVKGTNGFWQLQSASYGYVVTLYVPPVTAESPVLTTEPQTTPDLAITEAVRNYNEYKSKPSVTAVAVAIPDPVNPTVEPDGTPDSLGGGGTDGQGHTD